MFRGGEDRRRNGDKQSAPGTVRVITTRYQDAVPFYIDNGFAQAGATAANAVVKALDREGRQGAVSVARRADQAVHRLVEDAAPTSSRRSARRCSTLTRPQGARNRRLQGLRRAEPRRRDLDHRLARTVDERRRTRLAPQRSRSRRSDGDAPSRATAKILRCTIASRRATQGSGWPTQRPSTLDRHLPLGRRPRPAPRAGRGRALRRAHARAPEDGAAQGAGCRARRSSSRGSGRSTRPTRCSVRSCTGTPCASAATNGSSTRPPASRRCCTTSTRRSPMRGSSSVRPITRWCGSSPPRASRSTTTKRPFVIVDPRAGHGPGIGGFKDDSDVGVALRAGHPVYFVDLLPRARARADARRHHRRRGRIHPHRRRAPSATARSRWWSATARAAGR